MNYFEKFKDIKSVIRYGGSQTHHVLSVVIPTYKKPVSLKRALESVLHQKNKSIDYNIVIVENYEGNVSDIISMLAQLENPNSIEIVYYQNEKNIGMHPNWNRAFELADADYALMLHTDDYLLPQCFDCVSQAITEKIPALIISRLSERVNNEPSYRNVKECMDSQLQSDYKHVNFHIEKYKDVLVGVVPVAPTGFLARKDIFISSGGYNTKAHTWPADLEYAFNLIGLKQLYFCDKPFVVKTEGDDNDGSNLKSTVPLIYNDGEIFMDIARKHHVMFRNQIVCMRLADISKGFRIDYDEYLTGLFPKYYLNSFWSFFYRVIRKLQRISLHRR